MATQKATKDQQEHASKNDKNQKETASKAAENGHDNAEIGQDIDQLLQTLDSDLTDIDTESALSLIDHWHGFLKKAKEPGTQELAADLKDLQKMLKGGKATGHEISEVLIHIGEQTSEFSGEAEKGLKQPVQRLGKQLRKAGTSVAKAEDQEYHEQLDAVLEKAEEDDLTALDTEAAVGAIDFWYNLLHKAEGEQYKALANSLKSLKQALNRGNSKAETIAKALTQVGEQTAEIASETPRGFKGAVQKLGKQLTKAAESLTETAESK
ncbi:MAG TPA: hypothetical protein V6D06_01055 [Trichocoleus sp.]